MIHRAKAPLRLGIGGGGTDVSPYSDRYGGHILNATINMFAHVTIQPRDDGKIVLKSIDREVSKEYEPAEELELSDELILLQGVYNRIIRDWQSEPLSFTLSTYTDAPAGSGLGSSSTLVVAIVGAFAEWLNLPLGEYDIAHLAYEIERNDLDMAGGKQDQYAATFGGFNFMEFYDQDRVVVNPLRIKTEYINELQNNLLLYFTGTSRLSSNIIEAQVQNVDRNNKRSIEAMHNLKKQASMMKETILKGEYDEIGRVLEYGWEQKKRMAKGISSKIINDIYDEAVKNGATGGKVSGAGGGGFMMLYCPENTCFQVKKALKKFGGSFKRYQFVSQGLETWSI